MNGFRLLLCILGLVAYAVTKQFTAPENEVPGLVPPGYLIGLSLSLPPSEREGPALLWTNSSSNAEPSLIPSTHVKGPSQPEPLSLNVSARNKAQNAQGYPFKGSMRLERN